MIDMDKHRCGVSATESFIVYEVEVGSSIRCVHLQICGFM
jgi:hypothetical protein